MSSNEAAAELVAAIAHEVGNHLGAIRLQAHLLDEDLDARGLAEASMLIDGLAGRSGPLLALLRPLLAEKWPAPRTGAWSNVAGRVAAEVESEGTRGVPFLVEGDLGGEATVPVHDWLHSLLAVLVGATLAHLQEGGGGLRIAIETTESEGAFVLTDDGLAEELGGGAARRGRPLCVAIATVLVERAGGRVAVRRDEAQTRVALWLPRGDV